MSWKKAVGAFMSKFVVFFSDKYKAGAIEYALVAASTSLTIIAAVQLVVAR
jgi:Flp pilus assembly pilin Flp